MTMQANTSAVFVPNGYRTEVEGESRSVAVARINAQRLESIFSTMLGREQENTTAEGLGNPLGVSLTCGRISFDAAFRALLSQVDAYA